MPTKLPKHLREKLKKLHVSRQTCSVKHCHSSSTDKWEGSYVCDAHYKSCWKNYMNSWIVFISQITNDVIIKMALSKDERCIIDPDSCLGTVNIDAVAGKISTYIMNAYIPDWAKGVVTDTIVTKGVVKGLMDRIKARQ